MDHVTVLDQVGEITVDAPDDADSETIGEALTKDNEYETVDEGYDAVDGITRRTTTDNPSIEPDGVNQLLEYF